MSVLAYIFVFGVMGGLMLSVVYGLYWAVRRGQFSDFSRGAASDLRRRGTPRDSAPMRFPANQRKKEKRHERTCSL